MNKVILSLFDYSGNWTRPYRENGYPVAQIDMKLNIDIMDWDYTIFPPDYFYGILAAVPCTDYAISGARWFAAKDMDGRTDQSQLMVARVKEILDYFDTTFWVIENPKSRIHMMNPWLGKIKHRFNPCDYAGYDLNPNDSRYNKETWLWGEFNIPEKRRLNPLQKDFPGFKNLGGKSERTKTLRSITPLGFAYAFYEFNK